MKVPTLTTVDVETGNQLVLDERASDLYEEISRSAILIFENTDKDRNKWQKFQFHKFNEWSVTLDEFLDFVELCNEQGTLSRLYERTLPQMPPRAACDRMRARGITPKAAPPLDAKLFYVANKFFPALGKGSRPENVGFHLWSGAMAHKTGRSIKQLGTDRLAQYYWSSNIDWETPDYLQIPTAKAFDRFFDATSTEETSYREDVPSMGEEVEDDDNLDYNKRAASANRPKRMDHEQSLGEIESHLAILLNKVAENKSSRTIATYVQKAVNSVEHAYASDKIREETKYQLLEQIGKIKSMPAARAVELLAKREAAGKARQEIKSVMNETVVAE